ncbi:MAG: tetratricopeptide repeat protein [Myxococcales bacterium]|nr:tetratricopeptide repeat protein [Myxococcales bacterium]
MTAGQRLAAKKAAKASRKVEARGRTPEVIEARAIDRFQHAADWISVHTREAAMVAGVIAVVAIAYGVWHAVHTSKATAAGDALWAAVEDASAPVGESPAPDDATGPHFATEAARADAALAAYEKVASEHPSSDAAAQAKLGAGVELYRKGAYDDARKALEAVASMDGASPEVVLRALETVGFSYEAQEQWDKAAAVYEKLASEQPAHANLAKYALARVTEAKGDTEKAKTLLVALVDETGDSVTVKAGERPSGSSYVRDRAQLRLRALDATLVKGASAPAGGPTISASDLQKLPPEVRQQILQKLLQSAAGKAGGAAPSDGE